MTGVEKIEHAHLRVTDLDRARSFYTEVLGLTELEADGDTVYFGCGLDGRYDLAVEAGDTGLDHFAVRVAEGAVLESAAAHLAAENIPAERTDGDEPGVEQGLRFEIPSGIEMELVVVDSQQYRRPFAPAVENRTTVAPNDLEHVNLISPDVQADMEFMSEVIGQQLTEVSRDEETGEWMQAFARYGDTHHDIGCTQGETPHEDTLHHLAWVVSDVSHLTRLLDRMAAAGQRIEVGVTRHAVASNIVAYFWEPGGNRFELTTEMATLDDTADPIFHDEWTEESSFTAWGGIEYPETWSEGS